MRRTRMCCMDIEFPNKSRGRVLDDSTKSVKPKCSQICRQQCVSAWSRQHSSPLENGGQTNRTGRRSGAAALAACPPKTLSYHKLRQLNVFGRQNSNPRFERERRFASARVQNVGLTSIFQRAATGETGLLSPLENLCR